MEKVAAMVTLYLHIYFSYVRKFSLMLKNNNNLRGINIGGTEYKLSQYADDTTILLDGSEQSTTEALETLNLFALMPGLEMNT